MEETTLEIADLSVAELKALQSPGVEHAQAALHLTLKELALLGWIKVTRASRPTPVVVLIVMAVICIGLGFINPFLLLIGALYLGYKQFLSDNRVMLIQPTEKGLAVATASRYPTEYNKIMLVHLTKSVNSLYGNCTVKEWRKSLGEMYDNNADFYKRALLVPLAEKKLLQSDPSGQNFERTAAGDAVITAIGQKMQQGSNLSYLLRMKSPGAVPAALALGTLVLLMSELDGYYQPMASMMQGEPFDLQKRSPGTDGSYSDGGSGSSDGDNRHDQQDHDGLDYDSSSDFLDGSFDGGGSESGCGVGSDGGGDGGCSGDGGGGDGGCGSGCGGCGGGD